MIGKSLQSQHRAAFIAGIEARRKDKPRKSNPIKAKRIIDGFDVGEWIRDEWFAGWDAANHEKEVVVHTKILGKYFNIKM